MDKLKQAMQSEDFWIELADTSFGKIILHGKNTNSIACNEYYEVSREINTDGDFAIIRDSAENPRPTKSLGDECAATGLFRYPSMERMQLYI